MKLAAEFNQTLLRVDLQIRSHLFPLKALSFLSQLQTLKHVYIVSDHSQSDPLGCFLAD